MSTPLTDQLRAYFDDVDRQQGAVDIDALRRSVEERVTMIELSPDKAVLPNGPTSGRRWPILAAAAAVVLVVVGALVVSDGDDTQIDSPSNEPSTVPTATTVVAASSELVVRPLDPPIECELELCPSLAVSPEGTLVAYDQAAKTLTWYDAEPHVVPVTADLDTEHVQLEFIGPRDIAYLLAGSPESWELVEISQSGEEVRRPASSSPDIESSAAGPRERFCWTGCEPSTRLLMPWLAGGELPATYPEVSYTTGTVTASAGELRWTIAWPHTLSTRSQVGQRWDGGAVLSLVPESADAPSELIELLPDGTVQRFGLGDEAVHVLLPDGSAVVWRDGQLVRLSPPRPAEPPAAWSPELTAQPLEVPIACNHLPWRYCPALAVSPDGTLVAWDKTAGTLTWYEEEPRVVPVTVELPSSIDTNPQLLVIGPHDIAYITVGRQPPTAFVAVAPSGAEITRVDTPDGSGPVYPAATGLVAAFEWPNGQLWMPWVDLDGNPITDTRPYPTATVTDAGIEVRLGEREWLIADAWSDRPELRNLLPRSDGGVVMVLDTKDDRAIEVLELSPDGTIERYFVDRWRLSTVLPDGSLIVEHNLQMVRLTPPT